MDRRRFLAASAVGLALPWRALAAPDAPTRPPAPLGDERPPQPFADAVWADGRWFFDHDTNSFRWVEGMWIAPLKGYAFIQGRWVERYDGAWAWETGGWARPGSSVVEIPFDVVGGDLVVDRAPPEVLIETRPPPPSPLYVWSPGYWYWAGVATGWVWIGGVWLMPPRPGLIWIAPRWRHVGSTWVYVYGGWGYTDYVVVPVYRHRTVVVVDRSHPHRHIYDRPRVVHRPPARPPAPRPRPRPTPYQAPHPAKRPTPSKKKKAPDKKAPAKRKSTNRVKPRKK